MGMNYKIQYCAVCGVCSEDLGTSLWTGKDGEHPLCEKCLTRKTPGNEPSAKDTNPKDAVGTKKVPFSTVPGRVVAELGLAMLEGALKYGRHNYRVTGVRASVYFDAALRHLWAWWEGQDIDQDSGLPHVVKAMACLTILRDADYQGKLNDDRPPPTSSKEWVTGLNIRAAQLIEKYPEPKPAHTAEGGKP